MSHTAYSKREKQKQFEMPIFAQTGFGSFYKFLFFDAENEKKAQQRKLQIAHF